jgi:hypothetical protein
MSGAIRDVTDGRPNFKVTFNHCTEEDYIKGNSTKVSFDYDRWTVFKDDSGAKLLIGGAGVGNEKMGFEVPTTNGDFSSNRKVYPRETLNIPRRSGTSVLSL